MAHTPPNHSAIFSFARPSLPSPMSSLVAADGKRRRPNVPNVRSCWFTAESGADTGMTDKSKSTPCRCEDFMRGLEGIGLPSLEGMREGSELDAVPRTCTQRWDESRENVSAR